MSTKSLLKYNTYVGCIRRNILVAAKYIYEEDDFWLLAQGEPLGEQKGKKPIAIIWMVWPMDEQAPVSRSIETIFLLDAQKRILKAKLLQKGVKNYVVAVYVTKDGVIRFLSPKGVQVTLIPDQEEAKAA